MIHIAIADDHPEMRLVLRLWARLFNDIELVCESHNGQQAVECVSLLQPDVLIMDIQMPVLDGLAATKQITDLALQTRVVLISSRIGPSVITQAIAAGARGFVPKDHIAKSLRPAVDAVLRGATFFMGT